jgi:hypothetical protein
VPAAGRQLHSLPAMPPRRHPKSRRASCR